MENDVIQAMWILERDIKNLEGRLNETEVLVQVLNLYILDLQKIVKELNSTTMELRKF